MCGNHKHLGIAEVYQVPEKDNDRSDTIGVLDGGPDIVSNVLVGMDAMATNGLALVAGVREEVIDVLAEEPTSPAMEEDKTAPQAPAAVIVADVRTEVLETVKPQESLASGKSASSAGRLAGFTNAAPCTNGPTTFRSSVISRPSPDVPRSPVNSGAPVTPRFSPQNIDSPVEQSNAPSLEQVLAAVLSEETQANKLAAQPKLDWRGRALIRLARALNIQHFPLDANQAISKTKQIRAALDRKGIAQTEWPIFLRDKK